MRLVAGIPAAVLLLHQARTVRSGIRGPLTAFADILIDMQLPPGDRATRRRHFHGVGRYPGTLQPARFFWSGAFPPSGNPDNNSDQAISHGRP